MVVVEGEAVVARPGEVAVVVVALAYVLTVGAPTIGLIPVTSCMVSLRLIRLLSLRILDRFLNLQPIVWFFQLRSTSASCHFEMRQDLLLLRSLRPVHLLLVLPLPLPLLGLLTQELQII
jgi:hypothetical protein